MLRDSKLNMLLIRVVVAVKYLLPIFDIFDTISDTGNDLDYIKI